MLGGDGEEESRRVWIFVIRIPNAGVNSSENAKALLRNQVRDAFGEQSWCLHSMLALQEMFI